MAYLHCQGKTTVCQGDSITYGKGVPDNKGYPERLQELRNEPFIDKGISGISVRGSEGETQKNIDNHNPDRVILMLGTNNINSNGSISGALNGMQDIINIIRSNNKEPVVCTIPPFLGPKSSFNDEASTYNSGLKNLGANNNITVVRIFAAYNNSSSFMQSDGFHPNTAGQILMASVIDSALGPPAPDAPKVFNPSGPISNRKPAFRWSDVQDAERYQLSILKDGQLWKRFDVNDNEWTPVNQLSCNNFDWFVRSFGNGTYGEASDRLSFRFKTPACCIPPKSDPVYPRENQYLKNHRIPYIWKAVSCATRYKLWINRNGQAHQRVAVNSAARNTNLRIDRANSPFGFYSYSVESISPDGARMGPMRRFNYGRPFHVEITNRLISWNDLSSQEASHYHVRLLRNGNIWYDNRNLKKHDTGIAPTDTRRRKWQLPKSFVQGNYELIIRAKKSDNIYGPWSPAVTFTR